MEITPEHLTVILAIALGGVKIAEIAITKLFGLITGRKGYLEEIKDQVAKATNNHLHTIENAVTKSVQQHDIMIEQGKQSLSTHEKQIELLGKIEGRLSK